MDITGSQTDFTKKLSYRLFYLRANSGDSVFLSIETGWLALSCNIAGYALACRNK
jgi:hypothetical protein